MSIDVEIYQQASKVIEDESYKRVSVERVGDQLVLTVYQMFDADSSLDPIELLRLAGFSEVDRAGVIPRARTVWRHSPDDHWQVTAMYMQPRAISLEMEWPIKKKDPKELRDGLRALNRVFNAFRTKMEAPCLAAR